MTQGDFWDNKEAAQNTVTKVSALKSVLEPYRNIASKVEDFATLAELAEEDEDDSTFLNEAERDYPIIIEELDKIELLSFLSDKNDANNAFITVNAGAGGTESNDWASILFRMYSKWAERSGFDVDIVAMQSDDEGGLKTGTLHIKGPYARGHLRSESGVHRLVRISPFDSNSRRHTSFSAVEVVAELDDDIDIDIDEKDMKFDYFRASGAGGQHVNTTDSAVRITHIPTGVVVSCQIERSQHKNKATALKMLAARLYELEEQKKQAEADAANALKSDNAWGNQIRSYVLHPYKMVKDLRTGVETSNTSAVLDGDIGAFIEGYLRSDFNITSSS